MKKIIIIYLYISFLSVNLFSISFRTKDFDKGPLIGKNLHIPYLIYLNYPGERAKTGEQFELYYHLSVYFTNDFYAPTIHGERDYESLIFEFNFTFNILKNLQITANTRLITFYGGFLDNIVQSFHYAFGFPNAGRDYFKQNDVYINIDNNSNVKLYLDKPAFSFGDIDIWLKYTLIQNKILALAFVNGFKIPSGYLKALSGSGYPDFGIGLLLDITPVRFISFYLQSCIIFPIDAVIPVFKSKPAIMFQNLISLSINPMKNISLIAQLITKTPALDQTEIIEEDELISHRYSLPQVNILAGFIVTIKNFKIQFYFEENPIYEAGTDITFNFLIAHKIKIRKHSY